MTDDYAVRRKEYVADIRKSFDIPMERTDVETGTDDAPAAWIFFKIRMIAAMIFMLAFLFLKINGYEVYGYTAEDVIDAVSENILEIPSY